MRYRVGLDVGTASLGLAAVSLDESNNPIDLIWKHVRIFSEQKNAKGQFFSKKAIRREKRQQRRQIDRRKGRTKQIAALASLLAISIEPSLDSGRSLLELRAKAAREQISLSDLIRIFIRIGKRRGYAGEFRPKKEGAKIGEVEGGNNDLKIEMKALADAKGLESVTLGEFLYQRWLDGKPTKLKIKELDDKANTDKNLYALRSQLEAEFEQIWQTQSVFYPVLNSRHDNKSIKEIFEHAIFYQRPLKAVGGMVGQCGLEPTHARAPRAQLAFQHFRIEKTLGDLRWGAGKRADKLSAAQKAVIRQLCDEKEVVTFKQIEDALKKAGCSADAGRILNLKTLSRDEISGNKTNYAFHKLDLGEIWLALNESTQIQAINFLADLGSPEELDDALWHTRFSKKVKTDNKNSKGEWIYKSEPKVFTQPLIDFINKIKAAGKLNRLNKMGFDGGRASYSIKALNKLTKWLVAPHWPSDWNDEIDGSKNIDGDGAIRVEYRELMKSKKDVPLLTKLSLPIKTGNAVVDNSLRQIFYTVNRMIQDLGEIPEQCVVEFSRDMGVGITRRNEREKAINDNRLARKDAIKEIKNTCPDLVVANTGIFRYSLYKEQNTKCPYCGQVIDLSHAMDGGATEIDHIIPKGITQIGRKRSEVVLVHSACNQEKKKRSPWEAWGNTERWRFVEEASKLFLSKAIKLKSSIDAAHREGKPASNVGGMHIYFRKAKLLVIKDYEKDESVDGFADSQLQANSWIAKEAALWLQSVCKTPVSPSRGELTAMQRRGWGLDSVIPEVRYEENLPVLDEGGLLGEDGKVQPAKPISKEDFAKLKKYIDGHPISRDDKKTDPKFDFTRRPEKRQDHRHHLIDAITIALTSRELFRQMAITYKAESERQLDRKNPKIKVGKPPLVNIRELALAAIKECLLSIKPDRKPDGAMFKDNPYGRAYSEREGKFMLTKRYKLIDLVADLKEKVAKDGSPKKTIEQQARDNIQSIVSVGMRRIVLDEFDKRIKAGKTVIEAMLEPIHQEAYLSAKTKPLPIKRVVCFSAYSAEEASPIEHPNSQNPTEPFFKYLRDDGYAYMEIVKNDNGVAEPRLVDIQEGLQEKGKKEPQNVTRYYKGDVVEDLSTGLKYRIKKFSASDGKNPRPTMITLAWTESAEDVGKVKQSDGRMDFFKERLLQIKLVNQNV